MRKTSIMLEFSDDVYDSLVEPLKKSKAFSKFLASLVNGYLEDSYIRDYIDDSLEGRKRAIADSLNESINSMSESLSNMGLFTDELESISSGGKAKFKARAEKAVEEISGEQANSQTQSEEVSKINSRIDGIQESINSIFELLKSSHQVPQYSMPYIPQYPMGMMGVSGNVNMRMMQGNVASNYGMPAVDNIAVMKEDEKQYYDDMASSASNSDYNEEIVNIKKSSNETGSSDSSGEGEGEGSDSSIGFNAYNDSSNSDNSDYNESNDDYGTSDDFLSSLMEGNSFEF